MKDISISLTSSEALVLFEFLSRFDQDEKLEIKNEAEQKALWFLHGKLEKILVEPFRTDYVTLLEKAQAELNAI